MLRVPWGLTDISLYTLLPIILLLRWHPVIVSLHTGIKSYKTQDKCSPASWGLSQRLIFRHIVHMRAHSLLETSCWQSKAFIPLKFHWPTSPYTFFCFFFFSFIFFFQEETCIRLITGQREAWEGGNVYISQEFFFWSENLGWTFPDRIGQESQQIYCACLWSCQDTAKREVVTELLKSQKSGYK